MRAFVTGASGGIGDATARRLAKDGFELALHAFAGAARAETTARELSAAGHPSFVVVEDLSDPTAPSRLAGALRARWDALDLLVHNAGSYDRRPFEAVDDAALERAFRINFTSAFQMTRDLLPMLRRSEHGRIVFVSSVTAFSGSAHGAHYAAAKAALLGLARSLARELAPAIRVNVVVPGAIDTAILAGDDAETRRRRGEAIPLKRIGRPEEVAEAIAWLASPASSYVTGATLHVNGGIRSD